MFFKEVRRLFTGERLHKCEAVIDPSGKKFALELRRRKKDGDLYLLVTLDSGSRPFTQVMDAAGLDRLAEVVRAAQVALAAARRETQAP